MAPTLKSYCFSLLLHGSMLAVLYAVPMSVHQRFASKGQSQVITIQATQSMTAVTPVSVIEPSIRPLVEPAIQTQDIPPDADLSPPEQQPAEPTQHHRLERSQRDLPRVTVPSARNSIADETQLQRQTLTEPMPEISPVQPRRKATTPIVTAVPKPAAIPIEQFVGLEKEDSPDLSNNAPPQYPQKAIAENWQGVVILELKITSNGRVEDVRVHQSSGHAVLDQAAVDAVSKWQGKPAKRWGVPVESIERMPIRFRL
ncbi:energy transducer TonB [Stieleria sp. JC731]|uniref:energy transducer TonB n=1 Tax=Pirellulaceae TaxID=2691357 RepID=UPI001E2B5F15|nr:energy transducer TonB [Stieleria sp. JC731]MCC9602791.1 energy transducer TonB [Stieleria sp. JC731]